MLQTLRIISRYDNQVHPSELIKWNLQLSNFKNMVLKPHEEKTIVTLKLKPGTSLANVMVNSHLVVKTNISDVLIPLLSYNGKLELVSHSYY